MPFAGWLLNHDQTLAATREHFATQVPNNFKNQHEMGERGNECHPPHPHPVRVLFSRLKVAAAAETQSILGPTVSAVCLAMALAVSFGSIN